MATTEETFDKWLDQGYIEYEGWHPSSRYQGGVAQRAGLSLGPESTVGGRRPGGGGLPFSREGGDRSGKWKVESKQDILDYLKFAGELGVSNQQRLKKLGIPQYTGQDIYDYFIRPQEVARLDAAEAGARAAAERGTSVAASEAGRLGLAALTPSFREMAISGVSPSGTPGGRRAIESALKQAATSIEQNPYRLSDLAQLEGAYSKGLAAQQSYNETIAEIGSAMVQGGGNLSGMDMGLSLIHI